MRVKSGPSGARRTTGFASGEQARLTLFGAAAGPRLAWRVDYKATSREHYDGVVDATSGRLLWRANRVKSFTGNVFDYYLGAPDGGTLRNQDLTTPGWLPSTATNLTGPNAHTWSDINDDNVAQPTEEVTPESGDFNFAFTPFTVNGAPRCLPNAHLRLGSGRRPLELADQPQAVGHRRPSSWSTSSTTTWPPRRSASTPPRATSRATTRC